MGTRLSVSMIVKNEEALLSRCLDSVAGADEIVVCDTGSTDTTVEIARKYTDKVFTDYEWQDDFAQARNHSLSKCTGDWIFTIDADEVLEEGGMEKIREEIEKASGDELALGVTVSAEGKRETFNSPRLYRNDPRVRWKGAIHNHLTIGNFRMIGVTVTYGYSPAHKLDPNRSFRILRKETERDPGLVRERFYLAREYMYRKDWDNAIKHYKIYLERPSWGPQMAEAYLQLSRCYWKKKMLLEAQEACLGAIRINTHFREAVEFMAEITGPINSRRWKEFAGGSDNSGVLFNRTVEKKEKGAGWYDGIFGGSADMSRYEEIYETVAKRVDGKSVVDFGCGTAELRRLIDDYRGYDFSKRAVEIAGDDRVRFGDMYSLLDDPESVKADVWVFTEVFEHVDDLAVIRKIPPGQRVIFSIPSFDDPAHLRMFSSGDAVEERYGKFFRLDYLVVFGWNKDNGRWEMGSGGASKIFLVDAVRN